MLKSNNNMGKNEDSNAAEREFGKTGPTFGVLSSHKQKKNLDMQQ